MAIPQTRHAFPARLAQPGVELFIERSLGWEACLGFIRRPEKQNAPPFLEGRFVYKESDDDLLWFRHHIDEAVM